MPPISRPRAREVPRALAESALLAAACLVSYWVVAQLLARIHAVSAAGDIIGGMWAALATIFVIRGSYGQTTAAAMTRTAATLVSFAICLVYLSFLPFHPWALAVLTGLSALVMILLGRPGDAGTAGITTAVLIALAGVDPQHAWQQPILRLADTIVGVLVGLGVAWLGRRLPAAAQPEATSSSGRDGAGR
jgi:uncharacterized membrane protein YccC